MTAECKLTMVWLSNEIFPYVTALLFFSRPTVKFLSLANPLLFKKAVLRNGESVAVVQTSRAQRKRKHSYRKSIYFTRVKSFSRSGKICSFKISRFFTQMSYAALTMFVHVKLSLGHGQRSIYTCICRVR